METAVHGREIRKDNPALRRILRIIIWTVLITLAALTLIPFVWMISSSLKLDREVFSFPMRWIPETFHWENYSLIWQRVPLVTYIYDEAFIKVRYGQASAISMVLLVIVLLVTIIQFSSEKKFSAD